MEIPRSSGVQLHVTSLPGGRLSKDAFAFVDWLAAAGQSWWQVLPLGPPDRQRSPYRARSAFAASPALLADRAAAVSQAELDALCAREAFWIADWARYAGGRRALGDQARFEREWGALRRYAAERGVRLIGDLPIYVAADSADHVSHPRLFRAGAVAGAPPDAYSDVGQLWGNPLYDWPACHREGYRWWIERLRRTFELFDLARVDHFRGFVAYWAVPEGAHNAAGGRWLPGPGRRLFDAARAALGDLPLFAEDLGVITEPVRRLRDQLGLPGMVVLQFGLDPANPQSPYRIENHRENSVVYSATHDQDTTRGWWQSAPQDQRALALAQMRARGISDREPWWGIIRLALSSPARLSIVQAQDVLGLGSEARMNVPGRATGNWRWRLAPGALTPAHARRLRRATEEAGRLG